MERNGVVGGAGEEKEKEKERERERERQREIGERNYQLLYRRWFIEKNWFVLGIAEGGSVSRWLVRSCAFRAEFTGASRFTNSRCSVVSDERTLQFPRATVLVHRWYTGTHAYTHHRVGSASSVGDIDTIWFLRFYRDQCTFSCLAAATRGRMKILRLLRRDKKWLNKSQWSIRGRSMISLSLASSKIH